jgi:predicted amidohydrolase
MPAPILAAAQCAIQAGAIDANLSLHLHFMAHAQRQGVDLLLFPELSLTGYELTLAEALDSSLLNLLRELAQQAAMTTVVGLPLRLVNSAKPVIAAVVLGADDSLGVYTKQHLHPGEERYFSAGTGGDLLTIAGLPVALSVCADFSHPEQAERAAQQGAQVYAASVLIGEGGYAHDSLLLQGYAKRYDMAVLMANHGGPTGGWAAAGRSAFWDEEGACVAATAGTGDCLLIVSKTLTGWHGEEIAVSAMS